jgi:hypothetical protein
MAIMFTSSGAFPEPGEAGTGEDWGAGDADNPSGTPQADSNGIPQTRRKEHAIRKAIIPHTRKKKPHPVHRKSFVRNIPRTAEEIIPRRCYPAGT